MSSTNRSQGASTIAVLALLLGLSLVKPVDAQNQFERLYARFKATISNQSGEAEKAARAYLAEARQLGRDDLTMIGYSLVGHALTQQSQLNEAEKCFAAAVAASSKAPANENNKVLLAGILYQRGYNYSKLGQYELAVEALTDAAARLEKLPNSDKSALWKALYALSGAQITLARIEQAEATLERLDKLIARSNPEDVKRRSYYLGSMSRLRLSQNRFEEAERLCRQELELTIKWAGASSAYTGHTWNSLGILLMRQCKFHAAEEAYQQAAQIARSAAGEQSLPMADVHKSLGGLYKLQGRYPQGELHYRQAIETRVRILGPQHPSVIEVGAFLGQLYAAQNRHQEALPYLEAAYESRLKIFGPRHSNTQKALGSYCECLVEVGHWNAADEILQQALTIHGPEAKESLGLVQVLIKLYEKQARHEEALKLIHQSISVQKALPDAERSATFLAYEYDALGLVYARLGRFVEARDEITKAIEIFEADIVAPTTLALSYAKRAMCTWELNDLDATQADLDKAMNLVESHRADISGSDQSRSESFVILSVIYEHAVRLQTRRGDVQAALSAMERGRARSLLDQMAVQGIDLLSGVEPGLAQQLRDRKSKALFEISALESALETLTDHRSLDRAVWQEQRKELIVQLRAAQAAYASIESDIRNASPAYRLGVGRDFRPVALDELQKYVDAHKALLLRYVVGGTGVYLLVLVPDEAPRLISLAAPEDLATALGVPAGPLTLSSLNQLLMNSEHSGALQLLRAARTRKGEAAAVPVLHALWKLLLPEQDRQRLAEGRVDRLAVIPDGVLAMLPFEALVVEAAADPRYLLDVGPPIMYAPSASILYNLAESRPKAFAASVLSVGDPAYGPSPSASEAVTTGRSRYRAAGGNLSRLPHSGLEATWVEQVFRKAQIPVQRLVGAAATERTIRAALGNKSVIHLACHGVSDDRFGNLFGALAFAPRGGASAAPADSADDGVLALAEIYDLNLAGCELAILSACDTNIGPAQRGEGVWALSRGFLVAGAKRVVASNWVVDDKAAASLISYYCSFLAQAGARGEIPDYAKSLRDARRWVRGQDPWRSPYYWATFAHVGPN